jgi:hypothetical protein
MYYEVEISNGQVVSISERTEEGMIPSPKVEEDGWQFAENLYAGVVSPTKVTVKNSGKMEFNSPLFFMFSQEDDISTATVCHVAGSSVEPEGSEEVTFYTMFPYDGTWYVWIVSDYNNMTIIGNTTVEVSSLPSGNYNLEVDYDKSNYAFNEEGTSVTVNATIKDVNGTGYFRALYPCLYSIVDGNLEENLQQQYISNFTINPNGERSVTVTFDNLDKDKQYAVVFLYHKSATGDTGDSAGFLLIEHDTTGIHLIGNSQNDGEFYTLNGIKIIGKPKAKGIYMHNGKKIIIK